MPAQKTKIPGVARSVGRSGNGEKSSPRKKVRRGPKSMGFFLTSFAIRRMLRDNTPVDSTVTL